jgi:hypothetical protein
MTYISSSISINGVIRSDYTLSQGAWNSIIVQGAWWIINPGDIWEMRITVWITQDSSITSFLNMVVIGWPVCTIDPTMTVGKEVTCGNNSGSYLVTRPGADLALDKMWRSNIEATIPKVNVAVNDTFYYTLQISEVSRLRILPWQTSCQRVSNSSLQRFLAHLIISK